MADLKQAKCPILKGSKHHVTIEEAISDVLVVCLKHGAKMYRGVLLEASRKDLPYGLSFSKCSLGAEMIGEKRERTTVVDPSDNDGRPVKAEVSALSYRFTYSQDPNSTDPKLLPPPRRCITRPLRDKNVRSMRLRPRQVLCSKCKQGVHDTAVQNTPVPAKEQVADPPVPVNNTTFSPDIVPKMELRKRKSIQEAPEVPPKKVKKEENGLNTTKSPVIKICFSSPQGGGTVVKIPAKSQNVPCSDNESADNQQREDNITNLSHDDYKKMKKAMKKARLKERLRAGQPTHEITDTVSNAYEHHKAKHGKHKVKRKHRHREEGNRQGRRKHHSGDSSQENLEQSENKNVGETEYNDDDIHVGATDILKTWTVHDEKKSPGRETGNLTPKSNHVPIVKKIITTYRQEACDDSNVSLDSDPLKDSNGNIDSDIDGGSEANSNEDHEENDPFSDSAEPLHEVETLRPLMMRIQTRNVSKCVNEDGRTVNIGDVVWGKIHGFPWWPGRVISITISQRDNGVVIAQMAHVSWFGSSTMSHMPCSELYPFLEDFNLRYNKKKRGPYKTAIKQATIAAHTISGFPHVDIEGLED